MQYILLLIVTALTAVLANNACYDPDNKIGACIPLFSCPSLVERLRKRPLLQSDREFLARSQCGWQEPQPKVCCRDGIPQNPPNQPAQPSRPVQQPAQPTSNRLLPTPGDGVCGIDTSDRIYGGEATKIDEFPWLALLEYTKPGGSKGFHCGGVLISERYVLTASHCVNSAELPKTWTLSGVRLGEWNLETEQDCDTSGVGSDCADPVQDIPIERKIPHPQYEPAGEQQYNDLALLRLARPAKLSYFVRPICLPSDPVLNNIDIVGEKFQVAGWGKTETRSQSDIKLKVTVDGADIGNCNKVYHSTGRVISDSQLCAGGERGKDSCRGDSGGPLMGNFKNSQGQAYWYLAGLVSYGPSPCGQEGWPGVYTRVSKYINWIESQLQP